MAHRTTYYPSVTYIVLLVFSFSLFGPSGLIQDAGAATSNASARIIRNLKRQIASLKNQLAAATATPPEFVEMVPVGNPGNAADQNFGDGAFGSVLYEYSIGKYEVTLAQYTAFLNAVAATDTHNLYHVNMVAPNTAGIARSGSSGSFTYSVIGTGTRPVTWVSWFDAARFCNWLHNGRPTGLQTAATTENGAYPLNGATSGGLSITRNPGADFWIPSEDEWYKAAYHQPAGQSGDVDDYWLYPTKSNTVPGNTIGVTTPSNHANFTTNSVYSVTQSGIYDSNQNYLAEVGSYAGSPSFYGTFDQGGNVNEWNDAAIGGTHRGSRGGDWFFFETTLRSSNRGLQEPFMENTATGFRVAGP